MFRDQRKPQTFANHSRLIPIFHFVAFGIVVVNLGWGGYQLVREPSFGAALAFALAGALLILFFATRIFALTVQDRVIRLEERLRLERVLPADLRARIGELEVGQLVALRFAPDEELVALTRAVLDEKLTDGKAIKQRIRNWRPDYQRC